MTDEEKVELRAAKVAVSERLAAADIARYRIADVDERIERYLLDVAGNPERHNVYEQLAAERFLHMCDRYGLDRKEVRKFFTLYEGLHFPGKKGLQTYELTPVQAFQFAAIYGFRQGGKRVVREAVLFVPRKFSKTTGSAAFAIYDLLFGDSNAESYTGANSADQAKKCFDVIRGCIRKLDPKEKRYIVNEQVVKSKRKDRQAFCQCLTANARTKDGLNASTVIMDEFSQARDSNLLTVLTTSMGVRDNPLTVIITTASDVFDGPFYDMLQGYKKVLLGEEEDDSTFIHLFEPDVDDPEDSEATWLKVHPHLGVTVSMDFYRSEYRKAQRNGAEAMLAFRTKLLNVYAENERRSWISATLARSIAKPISFDAITGRPPAFVAIDLSESDDFSAVTVGYYGPEGANSYDYHTAYFFPKGALPGHPNEALYRKWAAAGHLRLTKGPVIDYSEIVSYVLMLNEHFAIGGIGYDGWHSQECINMLASAGAKSVLTCVKQSYGHFTAPCQAFEHGVKLGKIHINDNPINYYCFGNAVLDEDRLENFKPTKRKHTDKIDGVITMLMCHRQFIDSIR